MALQSSPPPAASGTVPGLVSLLAQTFAGAKTFLGQIVASAGIQVASLFNTNGTGASDQVVKVGTTVADASVNATAKLFSVWTSIGGSEVERLTLTKNGLYFNGYPNSAFSCNGSWVDLGVLPLRSPSYFTSTSAGTAFYANANGAFGALNTARLWSENASGASDVATKIGTYVADASVNAATKLASFRTGLGGTEVEKAFLDKGFGLVVNECVEIGGGSGTAYRDGNVVLTFNSASKQWLFNGYNAGRHITSLTRLGRWRVNGPVASDTQGASAIVRTVTSTNEPTFRVEGLNGQSQDLQQWTKNADTTPATVASIDPSGTFENFTNGGGVVLRSPDGTRWRLTITNAGAVNVAAA